MTAEVEHCKSCHKHGRAFELGGNRWHVDCFRCSSCNCQLDSNTNLLVLGDGSLICGNCSYHCHACNKKIEDLAILTGDQAFCSSCFCCRNCKQKIEDLRYAKTSQGIFCMACHESLLARKQRSRKPTPNSSQLSSQPTTNNDIYIHSNTSRLNHVQKSSTALPTLTPRASNLFYLEKSLPELPPPSKNPLSPEGSKNQTSKSKPALTPPPRSHSLQADPLAQSFNSYQRTILPIDTQMRSPDGIPSHQHLSSHTNPDGMDGSNPVRSLDHTPLPNHNDASPISPHASKLAGLSVAPKRAVTGSPTISSSAHKELLLTSPAKRSPLNTALSLSTHTLEEPGYPNINSTRRNSSHSAHTSSKSLTRFNGPSDSHLPIQGSSPSHNRRTSKSHKKSPTLTETLKIAASKKTRRMSARNFLAGSNSKERLNKDASDFEISAPESNTSRAELSKESVSSSSLAPADFQSEVPTDYFYSGGNFRAAIYVEDSPSASSSPQTLLPSPPGESVESLYGLDSSQYSKTVNQDRHYKVDPSSSSSSPNDLNFHSPDSPQVPRSRRSQDLRTSMQTNSSKSTPQIYKADTSSKQSSPSGDSDTTKSFPFDKSGYRSSQIKSQVDGHYRKPSKTFHDYHPNLLLTSATDPRMKRSRKKSSISLAWDALQKYQRETTPRRSNTTSKFKLGHRRTISDVRGYHDWRVLQNLTSVRNTSYFNISKYLDHELITPPSEELIEELVSAKRLIHDLQSELSHLKKALNSQSALSSSGGDPLGDDIEEKRKTIAGLKAEEVVSRRELGILKRATKGEHDSDASYSDLIAKFTDEMASVKASLLSEIAELVCEKDNLKVETIQLVDRRDGLLETNSYLTVTNKQLESVITEMKRRMSSQAAEAVPVTSPTLLHSSAVPVHCSPNESRKQVYQHRSKASQSSTSLLRSEPLIIENSSASEEIYVTKLPDPNDMRSRHDKGNTGNSSRSFWKRPGAAVAKGLTRVFAIEASEGSGANDPTGTNTPVVYGHQYNNSPTNVIGTTINQSRSVSQEETMQQNTGSASSIPKTTKERRGWFKVGSEQNAGLSSPEGSHQPGQHELQLKNVAEMKPSSQKVYETLQRRAELEGSDVPRIIKRCIEEVERRGLDVEGIYRKSGGRSQVAAIVEAFESTTEKENLEEALSGDVNGCSSALKQYLRHLPEPLITFGCYQLFISAGQSKLSIGERMETMRKVIKQLPAPHSACLELLIHHLVKVSTHSDINLMNTKNLSVVFAPTLARDADGLKEIMNMQARNESTQLLIEHCKEIFTAS